MEAEGYVLGETLLYESLIVRYRDGKRTRRYVVDFYVPTDKVAYELTWSTHRGRRKKMLKAVAAVAALNEQGILYRVEDERSVHRISLVEAASIPGVTLSPRAAARLRRSTKKRGRIKRK